MLVLSRGSRVCGIVLPCFHQMNQFPRTDMKRSSRAGVIVLTIGLTIPATAGVAYADNRWLTPNIAGLGDSYGSGESTGDYLPATPLAEFLCHRSRHSWQANTPIYSGQSGVVREGFFNAFVSCSGATTTDLISGGTRSNPTRVYKSQLPVLNASTDVVFLSIGGNDGKFGPMIRKCYLQGDCFNKATGDFLPAVNGITPTAPLRDTMPKFLRGPVKNQMRAAALQIRSKAPNAKIVWAGYPHLVGYPGALDVCLSTYGRGLSHDTRRRMADMADIANESIKSVVNEQVAAGYDFNYVDTVQAFQGHDACAQVPWIRALREDTQESFHPDVLGQLAYVKAARPAATANYRRINRKRIAGSILQKYMTMGANTSILHLPTGDTTGHGSGVYSQQFQDGAIYYSGATGAHYVRGGTAVKAYAYFGGRTGKLGLPTSDSRCTNVGVCPTQTFQHGGLRTSDANHYIATLGIIGNTWLKNRSALGDPIANQSGNASGALSQKFAKADVACWQGECKVVPKGTMD